MSAPEEVPASRAGGFSASCARALGAGVGSFSASVLRLRRAEAIDAIARAFPDCSPADCRRIYVEHLRNLGRTAGECGALALGRPDLLLSRTEVARQRFDEALARGRGVLFLSAHTGNWELCAAKVASCGYPFSIIAKEFRGRLATAYVRRMRERFGIEVLPRRNAYRACLARLKAGGMVGFMIDQNMTRDEGIFVEFLGRPACTTPGLAHLAAVSGAPVVPAFGQRRTDGGHTLHLLEAIDPPGDREPATVRAFTQRYSQVLEAFVRSYPEQWNWLHRRWRTRPLAEDLAAMR